MSLPANTVSEAGATTPSTPVPAPATTPDPTWAPKRTIAECDAVLTRPGKLHEFEHAIVYGRVLRVYKHLWPNARVFWLERSKAWADKEYVVYEGERVTYGEMHVRATRLASMLAQRYGVRKGDRVAIIMRNTPAFVEAFWAAQLLGAVATHVNAWAPPRVLHHCLVTTRPVVVFVDPERADRLCAPWEADVDGKGRCSLLEDVKNEAGVKEVFVMPAVGERGADPAQAWPWPNALSLASALDASASASASTTSASSLPEPSEPIHPDDPAAIFFTSGTTGLPKGVLSNQRGFLGNVFNALLATLRAMLRRGEDAVVDARPNDILGGGFMITEQGTEEGRRLPEELGLAGTQGEEAPQKAVLLSVPLFHVTGHTSTLMTATALGSKVVLMRKWDKDEAARLILSERITLAGGVPSMIMDLLESPLLRSSPTGQSVLEALSCGGAPSAETMPGEVMLRLKGVSAGQGYGLSETNAIVASIAGEDFVARPTSTGPATPVNDMLIVDPVTQRVLRTGEIGELWVKGPNVMMGYWADPDATEKAITKDGWFKTGDLAYIDADGFLYIRDRIKDIIIRGGENIHSTEIENALYADARIHDAAAVSVPDPRLGELVAAVVSVKPAFAGGRVSEASVIDGVRKHLPAHAVPVMVLVQDELIERNANGKIVKTELRTRVRAEWARRKGSASVGKAKAKL